MKKMKLIVLILSTFFAFGIQSASAQYVDMAVAKGIIVDKIKDISQEMEKAKDVGGETYYYQLATKHNYYRAVLQNFRAKTVAEVLDGDSSTASSIADSVSDMPAALIAVLNDKQFNLSLIEEVKELLRK